MRTKSIWLGLGIGSLFWMGDSAREVIVHQSHFISQVLNPGLYEAGGRLLMIIPLLILALYADSWMTKKRGEVEKLSRQAEIHTQLMEQIPQVLWMTDARKHRVIYVSPAYQEIWGRTVESLYQAPASWVDAIHPDDRNRIIEAARTKQISGEYRIR